MNVAYINRYGVSTPISTASPLPRALWSGLQVDALVLQVELLVVQVQEEEEEEEKGGGGRRPVPLPPPSGSP